MPEDTQTTQNDTAKVGSWELAALTLASGQPAAVAALAAGVKRRTIERWKKKPHFRQLVEEFRAAIVDEALGKLTANATKASDVFAALLDSPSEQTRLAAGKAIFDYRSRLRADGELTAKVNQLEAMLQELTSATHEQDREVNRPGASAGGDETDSGEHDAFEGEDIAGGD